MGNPTSLGGGGLGEKAANTCDAVLPVLARGVEEAWGVGRELVKGGATLMGVFGDGALKPESSMSEWKGRLLLEHWTTMIC